MSSALRSMGIFRLTRHDLLTGNTDFLVFGENNVCIQRAAARGSTFDLRVEHAVGTTDGRLWHQQLAKRPLRQLAHGTAVGKLPQ